MIPELRGVSYEDQLKDKPRDMVVKRRQFKKYNRTRGHEVTLVKDQCRLDIRKYSFSQRTINELNKSSTYCVNASR